LVYLEEDVPAHCPLCLSLHSVSDFLRSSLPSWPVAGLIVCGFLYLVRDDGIIVRLIGLCKLRIRSSSKGPPCLPWCTVEQLEFCQCAVLHYNGATL